MEWMRVARDQWASSERKWRDVVSFNALPEDERRHIETRVADGTRGASIWRPLAMQMTVDIAVAKGWV